MVVRSTRTDFGRIPVAIISLYNISNYAIVCYSIVNKEAVSLVDEILVVSFLLKRPPILLLFSECFVSITIRSIALFHHSTDMPLLFQLRAPAQIFYMFLYVFYLITSLSNSSFLHSSSQIHHFCYGYPTFNFYDRF